MNHIQPVIYQPPASHQPQFGKVLKDAGYSITDARILVFELLQGREPQSMHDLIQAAGGKIDRASLYRSVALFEQLGIVQKLYTGWKYTLELSDIFLNHHHHLSCLRCGKLVDISEDHELEQLIQALAAKHAMVAERHQLEIQGYCEHCQLANSTPSSS